MDKLKKYVAVIMASLGLLGCQTRQVLAMNEGFGMDAYGNASMGGVPLGVVGRDGRLVQTTGLAELLRAAQERSFGPFLRRMQEAFERNKVRRAKRREQGLVVSEARDGKTMLVEDQRLFLLDWNRYDSDEVNNELDMVVELIKEQRDPSEPWIVNCAQGLKELLEWGLQEWQEFPGRVEQCTIGLSELKWRARIIPGSSSSNF